MNSRESRVKLFNEMLQKYDEVAKEVKDIFGVEGVEIGMKEVNGEETDIMSFRIVVKNKKNEKVLAEDQNIPKHIQGYITDVVPREEGIPLLGTDDLPHISKESPLRGGIQIGNGKGKHRGTGTLGCIATLNDDSTKRVALSNHHVLYDNDAIEGQKIGHPSYYKSCCCDCDKIGTVLKGNAGLDCAIALLDSDIEVVNRVEEIGAIKGIAIPTPGDKVLKRGKTTGLTSGSILAVNVFTGFLRVSPIEGRQIDYVDNFLVSVDKDHPEAKLKYGTGPFRFAFHGDSGSVILNNEDGQDRHKVVALLNRIDVATGTQGFGFDINRIIAPDMMNITIHSTPDFGAGIISDVASSETTRPVSARSVLQHFEDRLKESTQGRNILNLINTHRNEVMELINQNRTVMVTWNRKQGPAFVAAFVRSAKHTQYVFPKQIEGITRRELLISFSQVLEEQGCDALKKVIEKNTTVLMELAEECESVEDIIPYLNKLELHAVPNI